MPSVAIHTRSLASYSVWYVRTLLSEVRSLHHRIRVLSQKTNCQKFPVDFGPMFEKDQSGQTVPCKATIARTQYIEFLLARYPWASGADVLLALDGWDKGTQYVLHTSDTSNMDELEARRDQYPLALSEQ